MNTFIVVHWGMRHMEYWMAFYYILNCIFAIRTFWHFESYWFRGLSRVIFIAHFTWSVIVHTPWWAVVLVLSPHRDAYHWFSELLPINMTALKGGAELFSEHSNFCWTELGSTWKLKQLATFEHAFGLWHLSEIMMFKWWDVVFGIDMIRIQCLQVWDTI